MPSAALKGIFQSLRTYYGDAGRHAAMDRLYGQFLKPGDLAFDIGAHVGDRIASFRRCGARVIPKFLPRLTQETRQGWVNTFSINQTARILRR